MNPGEGNFPPAPGGGMMTTGHCRWRAGIGYVLWLTAGLMLSAALLLAALWEAERQERLRLDAFGARLNDLARISATIIDGRLQQYDDSLLVLREAYAADPQGISRALELLRSGPLADRELMVVLVDRAGALAFTDAPRVTPHLYLGDRAYFRVFAAGGRDRLYVDEPVFGRVTRRHILPVARPIYDRGGGFLGIVAISVKQASLGEFIPNLTLAEDIAVAVVNRNGAIVTRSRGLEKGQGHALTTEQLAPLPKAGSGLFVTPGPGGGAMTAYRRLMKAGLIVYVTASPADALRVSSRQRVILVTGAGFTALVIMVLLLVNLERQRMTARFIEAQRRALAAESDARLRSIVQTIPDMIWLKDPEGRYLNCNRMVERFFGAKEMEIVGKSDHALMAREVADTFRAHDLQAMSTGQPCSHEQWLTFADDGHRALLDRVNAPLFDSEGTVVGVLGIAHDITALKMAEQELLNKNAELERFTYAVSHDLKSPLITIQAFAGQVAKDLAAGRRDSLQDDLRRIGNAASKMGQLLADLLELSRIGRITHPPAVVAMAEVIQEVLAQLAGPIKERQVEVWVRPDLPQLWADRQQLVLVVQGLVENAVKYMGDQAAPRIEIGAREEGAGQLFFVRDNGMGIDPPFHEEIFGLFNKLDPKSEGTGIGLALVKRSIEVQGGRVWVESAGAGHGSTFYFTVNGPGRAEEWRRVMRQEGHVTTREAVAPRALRG